MLVPNPDSIEGSQLLQVEQAQMEEDLEATKYTWKVENFTDRLSQRKLYSEVFITGNYKWRVLMFPKGNEVDHLSLYLDVADSRTLPCGWSRSAQFSLAVVNQIHNKDTIIKDTKHKFNARQSDWGFTSFMPLDSLYAPTRGYLVNDTVFIEAEISLQNKHLYTVVKVARDEDLTEQIGRDIYFDLVDHGKVRSFRFQKQTPFSLFKEEAAKEFGIPVQFQRFWLWAKRQNQTYRPVRPLTPEEELQSVGQLQDVSNKIRCRANLNLFLEVYFGQDLRPILPPRIAKEEILLFFKLYEPEKQELRYVGRLFVNSNGKPIEILEKLNQLARFAPEEEIEIYEEIKYEPLVMCEHMDKRTSFRLSQIEDGDIICFQKSRLESEECKYPDIPSFLEYLSNRKDCIQPDVIPISTPLIPVIVETCQHEEQADDAEAVVATKCESGLETASKAIEMQKDDLVGLVSPEDDQTLRRLTAAEEFWKSTSDNAPSGQALAALETVTRYTRSCLDSLCTDGAYEEFTAALKVLSEQGMIPLRITSMLKELLDSLEGEIPKYVELAKGCEDIAAQHEEIKSQMQLAMQKCQERKNSLANYDAKVAELEAELTRVREKRAQTMADLKACVDEMEPLKQRFEDSSSGSESFTVKQAMLTVQKGGSLGTWGVLQDVLKNCLKL